MKKQIIITGKNIVDITSFYQEVNRVFMYGENWKIGESLDAFNDLLYGGFGILNSDGSFEIIWNDIELSKAALGYEATRLYYLDKLKPGSPYNKQHFKGKLDELDSGAGKTYFDIIMEILYDHPNIKLIEN
jgi:RNAse (barnase) inhibitor barstar